ncbi:MAG: hypothetical protein F7B18_02920 [Desulfurococcales archaeon]|nr:hypothetical protein [Desulfurococcales archaeon]
MQVCKSPPRVIMAFLSLALLLLLLYNTLPGDGEGLVSWLMAYASAIVAASMVYVASSLHHSLVLGFFSLLSVVQLASLTGLSQATAASIAAGGAALAGAAARFRGVDSIVELMWMQNLFRPTPIVMGLTLSYLLLAGEWIQYDGFYGTLSHVAGVLVGGLLYSRISRSLPESFTAGALLGLGPVGGLLLLSPQAFRPLPPYTCRGLSIGELAGYLIRTSPTRMLVSTGQDRGIACSWGKAMLRLGEPLIIWLYTSRQLDDSLFIARGSRLVIDLSSLGPGVDEIEEEISIATSIASKGGTGIVRLGGVESIESRVALASAAISSNIGVDWLVIIASASMAREAYKLASTARMYPRILVALDGLSQGMGIAPPIHGRGSGVVIGRISDPGDQEYIARSLLGSRVSAVRELLERGLYIGYPYCVDLVMLFRPTRPQGGNL